MSRNRRGKSKADCRADTRGGAWAGIPKVVLASEAYRTLTPLQRAVLVEIIGRMDGYNNGRIAISYAELAHRLNRRNQAPFKLAIAELWRRGLIEPGVLQPWKERKAREYRLTFVNTVENGRFVAATNDYLKWKPDEKIGATDAVAGKGETATDAVADTRDAATDAVATANGKPPKTVNGAATDAVVLIGKPYPGTKRRREKSEQIGSKIAGGARCESRAPAAA